MFYFSKYLPCNTTQDNTVIFFDFPALVRNIPFLENIRFTHGLVIIFTKATQFLLYHPTSEDVDRQRGFSFGELWFLSEVIFHRWAACLKVGWLLCWFILLSGVPVLKEKSNEYEQIDYENKYGGLGLLW